VQRVHREETDGEAHAATGEEHGRRDHDEEELERQRPEPPDVLGRPLARDVAQRRDERVSEVEDAARVTMARRRQGTEDDGDRVQDAEAGERAEPRPKAGVGRGGVHAAEKEQPPYPSPTDGKSVCYGHRSSW
jgi:hypothetical protein